MISTIVFLAIFSSAICHSDYGEPTIKLRERALHDIVKNYFAHDPFQSTVYASSRQAKVYSSVPREEYQQYPRYPKQQIGSSRQAKEYSVPREEYQQSIYYPKQDSSNYQAKEYSAYPREEYNHYSQYAKQEHSPPLYGTPKSEISNYYSYVRSEPETYSSVPIYHPLPEYQIKRSYEQSAGNPAYLEKTVHYPALQFGYQQNASRRSRVSNPYPDHLSQFQGRRGYNYYT